MKKFFRLFKKTFPSFVFATFILEIEKYLKDCNTILDIGCGEDSPLKFLQNNYYAVGIDGHKPSIMKSKKNKIHDDYKIGNLKSLEKLVKKKSFDAVIALDVIEHFTKEDGYKLLNNMERVAKKRVILVTPNGFVPQYNKDNKLQAHLSGWSVKDFKQLGYKVEGIYGTKFCNIFRNEEAQLRFKPKILWAFIWGIIVEVSHHLYTKKYPEYSIGLLAVKKMA